MGLLPFFLIESHLGINHKLSFDKFFILKKLKKMQWMDASKYCPFYNINDCISFFTLANEWFLRYMNYEYEYEIPPLYIEFINGRIDIISPFFNHFFLFKSHLLNMIFLLILNILKFSISQGAKDYWNFERFLCHESL